MSNDTTSTVHVDQAVWERLHTAVQNSRSLATREAIADAFVIHK